MDSLFHKCARYFWKAKSLLNVELNTHTIAQQHSNNARGADVLTKASLIHKYMSADIAGSRTMVFAGWHRIYDRVRRLQGKRQA